jgi:hypothetical protein
VIHIEGLSQFQKEIATRLWHLETQEQIILYISSIPLDQQWQAFAVLHTILAEHIDQEFTTEEHCGTARELLRQFQQ